MTTAVAFLLIGLLVLAMGLGTAALKRVPVTSSILYLAMGTLAGPTVLGLFHFNPLKQSALLEVLTECAVLISLFAAGLKMPMPFSAVRWRAPMLLAFLSMAITVGLVAGFGVWALGLPLGAAVLIGAILAPTDPVLATDVQIRHAGDRDRLRFMLTCEAGINDGSAFPFVMLGLGLLGLHELGDGGLCWVMVDVVWATAAGIAIGVAGGVALAHGVHRVRQSNPSAELLNDFLGLGLIGAVYGVSLLASAWGFLAVFFAAVALRQTELRLESAAPATALHENGGASNGVHAALAESQLSEASLVFKEHLERVSELVLILLIGGMLFIESWSWRALGLALFLFCVARPLSVWIGLALTRTPWSLRNMVAWFGVRGIGSMYYLMYAIQHGLPKPLAVELIHLTLVVVTLSIIVHGFSVKPMMVRYDAS